MKILLLLICMVLANHSIAQISEVKEALPAHPRLLFMKGDEKQVQVMIKKDKRMRELHDYILSYSDSVLSFPCNERIKTGIRLLPISRLNIKYILYLSYSYRMTGKAQYAQRAQEELLKLSAFSDWNPSHFLDVAEMGLAAAIGYDWLYDYLKPESKRIIETAIAEKIISPSLGKYKYNMSRKNNWNQVCNTGTSIAALAIYEKMPEKTIEILNRAIKNLPIVMSEYSPNGAYIEGYGYWGYGTTYNVILIDLLQKLFGQDYGLKSQKGFMETGIFHQALVTPSLHYYNYGDNKNIPAKSIVPAIFWFYKETGNQDLLYNSKRILSVKEIVPDTENERFTPLALVWAAEAKVNLNKIKAPEAKLYQGYGENPVVCIRSSWSDKDAAFVGFKGGNDKISHGHQDAGSFIFEKDQIRWALELGQENYHQLEKARLNLWGKDRWKIYRYNCFNHNMLTFNGEPILSGNFIKLDTVLVTAESISCRADLTPLFKGTVAAAARTVALEHNKNCIIKDYIKCGNKNADLRWRMASETDRITKINSYTVLLHKKDKKVKFEVLNNGIPPQNIEFSLHPAKSENSYDSPNHGVNFVEFNIKLEAGSENLLQVSIEL